MSEAGQSDEYINLHFPFLGEWALDHGLYSFHHITHSLKQNQRLLARKRTKLRLWHSKISWKKLQALMDFSQRFTEAEVITKIQLIDKR